jgi:hypothetical protein
MKASFGYAGRRLMSARNKEKMADSGDALTPDMREARGKILGLAPNGTGSGTKEGPNN